MKKSRKLKWIALLATVALLLAAIPLVLLPSGATITANGSWYSSGATTLTINNASDLWAFATQLQNGTTFAGKKIKLAADITVNEGWDAMADSVKTPDDAWPLTSTGKYFAGTFDGQGHTISGLYMVVSGHNAGLFGNVATGTTATVKNLTIENSYIQNKTGSRTGGLFGYIATESNAFIADDDYVNTTKAVIDNVHLQLNIVTDTIHTGGSNGVGGFVGRNSTDVTITNSSFDGTITSGCRGVAAFVGATYPAQTSYDHDGDGATTAFYPEDTNGDGVYDKNDTAVYYKNNDSTAAVVGTANVSANCYKTHTVIQNCRASGTIDASVSGSIRFAGALVGYANANTDNFEISKVVSTMNVLGTNGSSNAVGYLFGGTFTGSNSYRNGTTTDRQTWTVENVFYEKTRGNEIPAFGKPSSQVKQSGFPQELSRLEDYINSTLGQSITLKSDLSLNLYATVLDPNAIVTINGKAVSGTNVDGWMKCYSVTRLRPQQMTEEITLAISQTIGSYTFSVEKKTSIRKYCEKFFASDDATKPEKDLLADMLRYGTATQVYDNFYSLPYATLGMDLTGYGNTFSVNAIPTYAAKTGTASNDYNVNGAALMLGNSLAMYLRFYAADISGLSLVVTINGRTKTYTENDFVALGNSSYMIAHEQIGAHEMNIPLTATLKKSGAQVGQALTYSIADYVKTFLSQDDYSPVGGPIVTPEMSLLPDNQGQLADSEVRKQKDLVEAMYTYGVSAEAYNDSTRRVFINGLTTDYVIVYDDTASDGVVAIARDLAKKIAEKTGVTIPLVKDTAAEQAKEIVLGNVDGRSVAATELGKLVAVDQNGYRMSVVDEKLVIATKSENLLKYAADRFAAALTTHGGITWSVPLDYTEIVDAPAYASSTSITRTAYYAGNNNHTLTYTSTATDFTSEYAAYVAQLKSAGFVEYTTNTISNNSFGTYVKTTDDHNAVVYTMHYPNSKEMRVTYGPLGYLPNLEEISVKDTGMGTSSPAIILNSLETANCSAAGLSLVVQLVDGSFFLVDGGNSDTTVTTHEKNEDGTWTDATVKTQAAKELYELLKSRTTNGKPVIAGWFMTHAHGDHMGLSQKFLETYHAMVDVRMVAYNFPDFDNITITNESATNMGTQVHAFEERIRSFYPNADTWVIHTGQKLYLPGCEIEVIFTPEDYYGMSGSETDLFPWGNHTSSAIRMNFEGMTMVVLGDCEYTLLQKMTNNYDAAYLESDILQLTHHATNGAYTGFYQAVDPKICLWPVDEYRYETSEDRIGNEMGVQGTVDKLLNRPGDTTTHVYANWWIRNTQWTRDDGTSGDRVQYAVSNTTDYIIPLDVTLLDPADPIETSPMPLE